MDPRKVDALSRLSEDPSAILARDAHAPVIPEEYMPTADMLFASHRRNKDLHTPVENVVQVTMSEAQLLYQTTWHSLYLLVPLGMLVASLAMTCRERFSGEEDSLLAEKKGLEDEGSQRQLATSHCRRASDVYQPERVRKLMGYSGHQDKPQPDQKAQHKRSISSGIRQRTHKGGWALAFKDEVIEAKFLKDHLDARILVGTQVIALLCCIDISLVVHRTAYRSTGCLTYPAHGADAQICILLGVMALALWSRLQRNLSLYIPTVLLYGAFVLAQALSPLTLSCGQMVAQFDDDACKFDPHALRSIRQMDCSLQGGTEQSYLILWILLSPWIVPTLSMMSFAWLWLFVAYLGTTLYLILFVPPDYFRWPHIAMSFALMSAALVAASSRTYYLEKSQRNQFMCDLQQKNASNKLYTIFGYMVPAHVVGPMLRNEVIAEPIACVSILFVIITDFDRFTVTLNPGELLLFLNHLFSQMDAICAENRVTKVETVAEEYVACVGVEPADIEAGERDGHGIILERLMSAAGRMLRLQDSEMQLQMGVHTGPIVAGVIGQKLPRFRLFGDTINTAARMMQKGQPGKLQFGEATREQCPRSVSYVYHGEVEMKGKGQVPTYFYVPAEGTPSFIPQALLKSASNVKNSQCPSSQNDSSASFGFNHQRSIYSHLSGPSLCSGPSHRKIEDFDEVVREYRQNHRGSQSDAHMWNENDTAFNNSDERGYFLWFHHGNVCKKFTKRLDLQAVLLSMITLLEAACLTFHESIQYFKHFHWHMSRLPVFIFSRLLCFLMFAFWRFYAPTSRWFYEKPREAQRALLFSYWLIGISLFFSYDMLQADPEILSTKKEEILGIRQQRSMNVDQLFEGVFQIMFYFVMTQTNTNSSALDTAMCWIPLSIFCILMDDSDVTGDLLSSTESKLFFFAVTIFGPVLAYEYERSSRLRYRAIVAVETIESRIEDILNTLLPRAVVAEMRMLPPGAPMPSHSLERVTVAQSDLCGFTKLASTRSPAEVVRFMSELFGAFDDLATEYRVYKVETIGDAYIAGMAESVLSDTNSPVSVVRFGLAMVSAVQTWSRSLGAAEAVNCRVGIHHGECSGGIVGSDMQRYHLFGELLRGLEVLESTAPEGQVQVSARCRAALEEELGGGCSPPSPPEEELGEAVPRGNIRLPFKLLRREEAQLRTSKGEIHQFDIVGGRTYLVQDV